MRPFRFAIQAAEPHDPTGWKELAVRAEDLGYTTLSMADHFDNALSPFPALMLAAEATSTLHVGTWVLGNDFRHPAVVARDALTLDAMSNGRFELGIGAGWMTTDYDTTGIALDSPGVRIDRLRESVTIIDGLLRGESVTHDGTHYQTADLRLPLAPTRTPRLPIVMGGGGRKMLRAAAQLADVVGVNPNLSSGTIGAEAAADGTAERTEAKIAWIKEAAGERFDQLELQTRIHICAVVDNPSETAATFGQAVGLSGEDVLESPHMLVGTVDGIAEKIHAIRERFGITYFTWGADAMDTMVPVIAKLT